MINDVLNFLNHMEIFNILNGAQYDDFKINRNLLMEVFESEDLDKVVELLRLLDDLHIDYLRLKFHFDKSKITTLREMIFDMYDEKICCENSINK